MTIPSTQHSLSRGSSTPSTQQSANSGSSTPDRLTRPSTQQSANSGSSAPSTQQSSIDHVRDFYFLMTQIADYKRSRHLLSKNMRSLIEAKCNTLLRKTIPAQYKPRIWFDGCVFLDCLVVTWDIPVNGVVEDFFVYMRDSDAYKTLMENREQVIKFTEQTSLNEDSLIFDIPLFSTQQKNQSNNPDFEKCL